MSEGLVMSNNGSMADASTNGPAAGYLLRAAREAQGLHIAALAVSLKVPVKKLEALEAGRFEDLPDAVFVRALASSVCRALKVDATPILEKLPQTIKPRLSHTEQSINAPFRAPGDGPGPSFVRQLSKPMVLAVLALLVGTALLFVMPDISQRLGSSLSQATSTDTASGQANSSGATEQAIGTQVSVADTTSASLTANLPAISSPSLMITTNLSGDASSQTTADGIVVFKASGETWVEVTDSRGKITLRRLLQAGDTVGTNATPPLRVTVGRADQTEITVRGKAYDLAGKVRDNVAKFEVK